MKPTVFGVVMIGYAAIALAFVINNAGNRKNERNDYAREKENARLYRELRRSRFARQNERLITFVVAYTASVVIEIICRVL